MIYFQLIWILNLLSHVVEGYAKSYAGLSEGYYKKGKWFTQYLSKYICVLVYVYMSVHTYIHTYAYACTHTYTEYIYIYIYIYMFHKDIEWYIGIQKTWYYTKSKHPIKIFNIKETSQKLPEIYQSNCLKRI